MRSAKRLGLEYEYLTEIERWDSKDEFAEVDFSKSEIKQDTLEKPGEKAATKPNATIEAIYKEAPQYLIKLWLDSTDISALG